MYLTLIIPLAELPNVLRALNATKPVEVKVAPKPAVKRGRGRPPKAK
jgi:hypothetical protein